MKDSFVNRFPTKVKRFTNSVARKYKFFSLCFHPKHHKTVGALSSSSKFLSKRIANVIDSTLTPKKILEVGAGTGPITKYILKTLQKKDIFDVVEITDEFIPELNELCKNYPQSSIFNGSILDFKPDYKYDYIVSALPFSRFSAEMVQNVLNYYQNFIKEGGTIIYFQYILANQISKFKDKKISKIISNFQDNFKVSKKIEYINLFPAIVWILKS